MPRSLILLLALTIPLPGSAQNADIQSPISRVALIELFTSEGCSSCPSAEQWLNRLEDHPDLWERMVPVAFHVDYWDYIGWSDRFAAQAHSQRQRAYRQVGHTGGVYTPGFVVGGEEWRGWFRDSMLKFDYSDRIVGSIAMTVRDNRFEARFRPTVAMPESLELHVTRLGFDLSTQVRAGENHGRTLDHEFVVLGWDLHSMEAIEQSSGESGATEYHASGRLPVGSNPAPREAVAVWVSIPGDPLPIQAAGHWLTH